MIVAITKVIEDFYEGEKKEKENLSSPIISHIIALNSQLPRLPLLIHDDSYTMLGSYWCIIMTARLL